MKFFKTIVIAACSSFINSPLASEIEHSLKKGFENPPMEAKPRVWWHWMDGNVTAEGARLDLEWMNRIGLGGAHVFSGSIMGQVVVDKPMPFMSQEWRTVFDSSADFLSGKGMEVTIAGSPGWSQAGGPWVEPIDGMKKYVWSETQIEGGQLVEIELATPPESTGPFQAAVDIEHINPNHKTQQHYSDSFIVAFPTPSASSNVVRPKYKFGDRNLSSNTLNNIYLDDALPLPIDEKNIVEVDIEYSSPVNVSSLSYAVETPKGVGAELLYSEDGKNFEAVRKLESTIIRTIDSPPIQRTINFSTINAQFFKVKLLVPEVGEPLPGLPEAFGKKQKPNEVIIKSLKLDSYPRIADWESKAGFHTTFDRTVSNDIDKNTSFIEPNSILNISDRFDSGVLRWEAPAGEWTILRFGWSLTGRTNGPAEPQATGLEVDKLDPIAVQQYLTQYLSLYPDKIDNILLDSWEAGFQNWTPLLPREFEKRRGYSLLPYLPVLTGRVVQSGKISEQFLRDFRKTLKEVLSDNYYKTVAKFLHAKNINLYSEVQGDNPRVVADGMMSKKYADIPAAEFWYRPFAAGEGQYSLRADIEESSSVANLYGKKYVAAEALTVAAGNDPWSFSPAMLKPVADQIFSLGVNRFLIHESHMQPFVDKKPGLTLALFGQYFNRHETWAEKAGPWIDYLSRTSFMLQQGRKVADVLYYYGEDKNLTEIFRNKLNEDIPDGYKYDYIDSASLVNLLEVENGKLVTPSGGKYEVLFVPSTVNFYSIEVLLKLSQLAKSGASIVMDKPLFAYGVKDDSLRFEKLASDLWSENKSSDLKLFPANFLSDFLHKNVGPDLISSSEMKDLTYIHRRSDNQDIYFISNQRGEEQRGNVTFRVGGKLPTLWKSERGTIEAVKFTPHGDYTTIHLEFDKDEAFIIVFSDENMELPAYKEARKSGTKQLRNRWEVEFYNDGGSDEYVFDELISWHLSDNERIKYFSGTALYSSSFTVEEEFIASCDQLYLNLGEVREIADLTINGSSAGVEWHPPYSYRVDDYLKPGINSISIEITNLWPNSLIGEKVLANPRNLFSPASTYTKDSTLLPSGLIGPVQINCMKQN